jgi:large subunit ribosomal protein L23
VFEVSPEANKTMIKEAVETLFNVTVERVNIIIVPAKRSRRWQSRRVLVRKPGYKKAIVQLAPGDSIDVFEGVR